MIYVIYICDIYIYHRYIDIIIDMYRMVDVKIDCVCDDSHRRRSACAHTAPAHGGTPKHRVVSRERTKQTDKLMRRQLDSQTDT